MATTLDTLISQCVDEVMTDKNKKIWTEARWIKFINQAIRKLQVDARYRWPENEASYSVTTTSGTAEYALPTYFVMSELARLDGTPLNKTTKVSLDSRVATQTTSKPSSYYIRGSVIGLDPIPNSAYTLAILYRKRMLPLSDGNDEIEFPDEFADAIVKYANYLAWSSPRGNRQTAAEKLQDYQLELKSLKEDYLARDIADLNIRVQRGSYPSNSQTLDA